MTRLVAWEAMALLVVAGCGGTAPETASVPDDEAAALEAIRNGDTSALKAWSGALVLPRWVPVEGRTLTSWTIDWWRWISAIPADQNPEFDLTACDVNQPDDVFFIPPFQGDTYTRSCTIPFGRPVLVEAQAVVNDFPCPDPNFHPAPGQSLEEFLREGAIGFNDAFPLISLEVDGRAVRIDRHRDTSPLFIFEADPSLVGLPLDPCLTGTPQPGVSDGWWAFVLFAPGDHTVVATTTRPGGGEPMVRTFRLHITGPHL
jgi:hypothetical protein